MRVHSDYEWIQEGWSFSFLSSGCRAFKHKISVPGLFLYCCSVSKLCPTLCDPMNYSTPGFPVLHHLLEFVQIHVHWVSDAIQPSHPVAPFSFYPQSLPASGSFPMGWLFRSDGQSIGASASASVLPVNIQGLYPLGLTDLHLLFC